MVKEPTISPSEEHKNLQKYLMEETPLNVALAQSGVFYLSPAYRLCLNLYNELLEKKAKQKDNTNNNQSEFSDKETKDPNKLTDEEEEFLVSMKGLVTDLVLGTTMTPGRQKIETALIKTLEKFGSVNYHIQQRGGMTFPDDPSKKRNP